MPNDSHLTERGKLIPKGLLASREVQSHCLADVSGSLVWVSGPCEAVVPFNYSKRENILGVRFLLQCRCMEGTIVLCRRVKKVIAIKWLQSLTVYWFYYISVLPREKKEHTRSNKNHLIGAECGRITLSSTCALHWSSRHLAPVSIQRVAQDCVAPRPGQGSVPNHRWQMAGEEELPTCGGPFTPNDRSDPSSQPRWTLLCCPYRDKKTYIAHALRFQHSGVRPITL